MNAIPIATNQPPKASVLLVDDRSANLLALRTLLDEMGYPLVEAGSGEEALRLMDGEEFAVVLLDVQMPTMDGFETATRIREQSRYGQTPIIFITAHDETRVTVERAYALGAVDFLMKPLIPVVLRAKVAGFVELFLKTEQVKEQAERLRQAERSQYERSLVEERQWFRVALGSIGDAVITIDAEGNVVTMNPVAENLTGWSQDEAKGQPLGRFFIIANEETRERVENPALRALSEQVLVGLTNHTLLIAKDGTERPIDYSAAPIKNEKGETIGVVLVFRDVGEQRRAARQVADSDARKTAILDSALDCIITIDHEGMVVDFNPAAEQTFGHRRTDVIGREMAELVVPPALRTAHRNGMARYLVAGEGPVLNRRIELTALRSDGTEFPVEVTITAIPGEQPFFTGYLRDITERKLAERAAAEQLRHAMLDAEIGIALTGNDSLRSMLQACAESLVRNLDGAFARIWTHDEANAVLDLQASAGLYTHLDGPHGRVPLGEFKIGLIAQERKPHLTNNVRGDPRVPEQEWAEREGLVAFAGYPLVVNYRLVGVMAMFARQPLSDATLTAMASAARGIALGIERKEMEDRLRQLVSDLSASDRRKDEFLATLAHELRNPLAPIRNGLQLMRIAGHQVETVLQARSMMERQLKQLVRLVDDLMDVSRITRGKLELRKERVPLSAIVNSAVETSRPVIDEMGHELTVGLPSQPIIVEADFTRLAQVFLNLLNNAAKYSDRGGRITLTAECQASDIVISVRDAGIGIDADHLPHIFDLFAQVDRSLEKSRGGLGIGLTLVRRLVEMHGGNIVARSEGVGKGSEFVVRLPAVVESAPARSPDGRDDPSASKSSLRILVVDDNKDSADSLAMMLRVMGNDARTAYDGQQGVDVAREFRPDVVLLDIGMPKLNGYEACRRIRQQAWSADVSIIAMTGWGQEEYRRRSQEAGFDQHMVKPVDPHDLLKILAGISTRTRA